MLLKRRKLLTQSTRHVGLDYRSQGPGSNLVEVSEKETALEESGLPDELEEPDVVVGVEGRVDVEREPGLGAAPHPLGKRFDVLQRVAVVQLEQDVVGSKLGLVGAADVLVPQVLVDVLQRLDALRQVLVVQLPVKLARFLQRNGEMVRLYNYSKLTQPNQTT